MKRFCVVACLTVGCAGQIDPSDSDDPNGLAAAPSTLENWNQYRHDERHTGWAQKNLVTPLRLKGSVRADGNVAPFSKPVFQADSITAWGKYAIVLGARAGGMGAPHASVRTIQEIDRTTLRPRQLQPDFFHTYKPGGAELQGIETSGGTWPWLYGERQGYFIESGEEFFTGASARRQSFDIYGPVTGRDASGQFFSSSYEEWHTPSKMWSRLTSGTAVGATQFNLWKWMKGVPDGPNTRPLGYSIRADAVFAGQQLVVNQVVSVKRESTWNRVNEPPPAHGGCGISVWDTATRTFVHERCDCQWGRLATDGELVWTTEQDWRTECERAQGRPYDQFIHNCLIDGKLTQSEFHRFLPDVATSHALVGLALPNLEERVRIEGFELPSNVQEPPLVAADKIVWFARRNGVYQVVAFDRRDGRELWHHDVADAWRKQTHCSYYSDDNVTHLAASGDSVVLAGRGITILDARTGAVKQVLRTENAGYEGLYFNPIVIEGQVWALRTFGNTLEQRAYVDGQPIPEGFVRREHMGGVFIARYDGEPPSALAGPFGHGGLSCGGYQVEVFESDDSTPEPEPVVTLGGRIGYATSSMPVAGVTVTATALDASTLVRTTQTGADGQYRFSNLPQGHAWRILPRKTGGTNGAVNRGDADYLMNLIVQGGNLFDGQRLAADVTGSGGISGLDAARIYAHADNGAPLPAAQVCGSDWLFMPRPFTPPAGTTSHRPVLRPGVCEHGTIDLPRLDAEVAWQNFDAVTFGDVLLVPAVTFFGLACSLL